MKPVIIIAVAIVIGSIVAIVGSDYYVQNQTVGGEPWFGLNCDEMLDFSASEEHQDLTMDQHMEFHQYYFDICLKIEDVVP